MSKPTVVAVERSKVNNICSYNTQRKNNNKTIQQHWWDSHGTDTSLYHSTTLRGSMSLTKHPKGEICTYFLVSDMRKINATPPENRGLRHQ